MRAKWRKKKLPMMAGNNPEKIWKTMAWAISDSDVPVMKSAWSMRVDPTNVSRWNHKLGFHERRVVLDTPLTRWAGEGMSG